MRQSNMNRIIRMLSSRRGTLAIILVVLVLGIIAPVALWILHPPADRHSLIEEAGLATAVLGFALTVITLLGTNEQLRSAQAPPKLFVQWADGEESTQVPMESTSSWEPSKWGLAVMAINRGDRLDVKKVSMRSEIVYFHDSTASVEKDLFQTVPTPRMENFFLRNDRWDVVWVQDKRDTGTWITRHGRDLEEGENLYLPPITLKVKDANGSKSLLEKYPVEWNIYLVFHTSRGYQSAKLKRQLKNR